MEYTREESSYKFYSVYLDDQSAVPSGKERWMAGLLDTSGSAGEKVTATATTDADDTPPITSDKERRRRLLERNAVIQEGTCDIGDHECMDKYESIPFESGTLPSARAAYVEFPFANGIVSAMVHSYKVSTVMLCTLCYVHCIELCYCIAS
jgi:hypothetical protein